MNYNYLNHFKYPENQRIWFNDHYKHWETYFKDLKSKPNVCLEDAVNSFYYLKNNGIMVFDDFNTNLPYNVKTGIDSFVYSYRNYLKIFYVGYQLFVQKINPIYEVEIHLEY